MNNRIQILFGKSMVWLWRSEPDEGTTVSICIPAVLYTEDNREDLEKGRMFRKEETAKDAGVKRDE
ncbi:MAG: hypothetical protein ACLTCI_04070 [[Clostridium] nexile]